MANPDRPSTPGPAAACAAGALSLAVAMGIGRFAFTPLLPLMIRDGSLDVGWGGWIAAANYAGYLAGALSAARLPLAPVRLALAALLFTALLTAAMALPLGGAAWLGLRFAAGVASAWAFVATSVWCLGELARLGKAQWGGFVYAGVGSGIALAGLWCLAGASAGAPALWLQLGLLALVLVAPVAWVTRQLVAPQPTAIHPTGAKAARPPAGTAGLVFAYGLLGFGYILPATFLPVLARAVVDDPRLFGLAWPAFGAMAALSTLAAGLLMRRLSRLQVWALAHLLMGAGTLLPSLWLNGWTIAASALLVGGTFMVATMAGVQEIRSRAPGDPTALVGRMTAAFATGQIAGPVLSAVLVQSPLVGPQGLDIALRTGAACLLGSAVWLWRLPLPLTSGKDLPHAIR